MRNFLFQSQQTQQISHTKHSDDPSADPFGPSGHNDDFVFVAGGHFLCAPVQQRELFDDKN